MRVLIFENAGAAVAATAAAIARTVARKPDAVLGLATGGTMEAVYAALIARFRDGEVSFARARTFNLDEYRGLPAGHPQSYARYMAERLFRHVDLPPEATHLPAGSDPDPVGAASDYEALLSRHGPVDLQLLGLGRNGHIGFNEPASSLASRTRAVRLSRDTLAANARFFALGEFQPIEALTMGIATILAARRIVLLATGAAKARATAAAVEGPLAAMCPASALQMHPDATMLLDAAAAGELRMREHYRWLQEQDAP